MFIIAYLCYFECHCFCLLFFLVEVETSTTRKPTDNGNTIKTLDSTNNDHKELIEKIQKDKQEFLANKKKEEEEKKQKELDKLLNEKKDSTENVQEKGITGGEPADPITKKRRNFVKKVS